MRKINHIVAAQQQILIKHRGNTCCSVKVLHLLVDGSSILSWSNMTHTPRAFIKIKTSKLFSHKHSAWKLPKKSHSTLRVKRAKFIFWVDNWRVFENPKLAGKQCLQTGHFWWKMTKLQNPNATFRLKINSILGVKIQMQIKIFDFLIFLRKCQQIFLLV